MHSKFEYAKIDFSGPKLPYTIAHRRALVAKLETISGRITHVGNFSSDAHCHTYSLLEIEAGESRLDLSKVVAAKELSRAIRVGNSVAMSVLRAGSGKNARSIILGIYDVAEQRTFLNEEMFTLRSHARKQALLYSFLSIVLVPVGLVMFVLPGLLWLWVLWKSWTSIDAFPEADEIREAVASLSNTARMTSIGETANA